MLLPRNLCHVSVILSTLVRAQLPPASQQTATLQAQSWRSPVAVGPASTVQESVQGIAGLMQRFEQMQPRLSSLIGRELQSVVEEGQKLHERFVELQEKLQSAGSTGNVGPAEEARVLGFHRDLAVFVEGVETKLGAAGPQTSQGSSFGSGQASGLPPLPNAVPPMSMPPLPNAAPPISRPSLPTAGNPSSMGSRAGMPGATSLGGNANGQSADQRLQRAMSGVVSGMQRFEVLHPKMRSLPQQLFTEIATPGQKLHEEFTLLQQRGVSLAGDGSKQMGEADGAEYASQLESFVERMTAFVAEAEMKIQNAPAGGLPPAGNAFGGMPPAGNAFGYGGMVGEKIPVAPQGAAPLGGPMPRASPGLGGGQPLGGTFAGGGGSLPSASFGTAPSQPMAGGLASSTFGAAPHGPTSGSRVSMPPLSSSTFGSTPGAAPGGKGSITPGTDRRLQAVVEKVVSHMQEFEALKPQLSRLNQQVLAQIAQTGDALNNRFMALQKQGSAIAGDGSVPMLESEASAYTDAMELFHQEQSAFVDQAKQASAGSGFSSAPLGSASLQRATLGSASLPGATLGGNAFPSPGSSFGSPGGSLGQRGSLGSSSFGSSGQAGSFGRGSLGGSLPAGTFGGGSNSQGGSLGHGSFGNSFGGDSLGGSRSTGGNLGGNLPSSGSIGGNSFSSGSPASSKLGNGFGRHDVDPENVQDSLKTFAEVTLDTGVLPGRAFAKAREGFKPVADPKEETTPQVSTGDEGSQCSSGLGDEPCVSSE